MTEGTVLRPPRTPPRHAVPRLHGDGPLQDWIGRLPDWQADRARRLDAIATRALPELRKAVRRQGVWYGVPGGGWFLALSAPAACLRITFFDGLALAPVPPAPLAARPARALELCEADAFDAAQLASWIDQAVRLPGWGRA